MDADVHSKCLATLDDKVTNFKKELSLLVARRALTLKESRPACASAWVIDAHGVSGASLRRFARGTIFAASGIRGYSSVIAYEVVASYWPHFK